MDEKIVLMFIIMFLIGIGVVVIIGVGLEVLSRLEFQKDKEAFYILMMCVCCLFGAILWFLVLGGWLG